MTTNGLRMTAVGGLMVATIVLASPAGAQSRPSLAGLQAQVDALSATVTTQQATIQALEARIADLEAGGAIPQGLKDRAPYVSVSPSTVNDLSGPHVIFTGANVHVRSGSGETDGTPNGRGNLIVGYNEAAPGPSGYRSGSHNLLVGPAHTYPS
jgi:hypothetical protein